MTPPRRRTGTRPHRHPLTLGALTATLALTGCTLTGGGLTPLEQLRARPTFEQATAGYVQMLTEMRAALTALVPTLRWDHPSAVIEGGALSPSALHQDSRG